MFRLGFAQQEPQTPTPEDDDAVVQESAESEAAPPSSDHEYEDEYERDVAAELALAIAPWGISILLHLGVILLAFFVAWSVRVPFDEEEIIVPIARLSATPGAPVTMQQQQQVQTRAQTARSLQTRSAQQAQTSLAAVQSTSVAAIGVAGGQAGQASPFGAGERASAGLEATFFGTGGNARRLVYLVDASGSLIDTFDFVIMELKRSINELSEQQSFTVFFLTAGGEVQEVPPRGLKRATSENKRQVIDWLDRAVGEIFIVGFSSSPVRGLQMALNYNPHLLFLLSDNITGRGRYEVDQRRLLRDVSAANRANTKINTIQFLYPDPLTRVGLKGTMQLIAEQSGGVFKFMDARELGIQ